MCGILGLINYSGKQLSHLQSKVVRRAMSKLLQESEIRGRDASGVAVLTSKSMVMFKDHMAASALVQTTEYSKVAKEVNKINVFRAMIGHTRFKTKGSQAFNVNNHPIKANRIIGVHNGFIHNDDALFKTHSDVLNRKGRVDSEIIFRLIDFHRRKDKTLVESVQEACSEMAGSYTCAFLDAEAPDYVTIFSNSQFANAYIYVYEPIKMMAFSSSDRILQRALKDNILLNSDQLTYKIEVADKGFRIDIRTGDIFKFDIYQKKAIQKPLSLIAGRN